MRMPTPDSVPGETNGSGRWFDDPELRDRALALLREPKTGERRRTLASNAQPRVAESDEAFIQRIREELRLGR